MSNRSPAQGQVNAVGMRQDDERRRDEARLAAMQNQVDELRVKHYESATAQNRLAIEQARQEMHQSAQARAIDETRTRQQIVDMDARVEDLTRPIRSLQAHVMELIEAARQKADDTSEYKQRDDALQAQIIFPRMLIARECSFTRRETRSRRRVRKPTACAAISCGPKTVSRSWIRTHVDAWQEVAQAGETITARIDELRSDLVSSLT